MARIRLAAFAHALGAVNLGQGDRADPSSD